MRITVLAKSAYPLHRTGEWCNIARILCATDIV
jgi:hypothetical protein